MAIAANFRKYPQALALQMPLPFGRLLRWATSRPTTTVLRAIRAERGRTFNELGRIAYPVVKAIPQWWKDAQANARHFAQSVKRALRELDFEGTNQDEIPEVGQPYQGKIMTVAMHRRLLRAQIIRYEEASGDPELIAVAAWRRRGMGLAPDAPL